MNSDRRQVALGELQHSLSGGSLAVSPPEAVPFADDRQGPVDPVLAYRFHAAVCVLFDVLHTAGKEFDKDFTAWVV